ncbi:hypothetical protein GCM10022243_22380 [Saccharothrix violaceirubra]|uniref:PH (Pleckstrin Homology) domain-containing protein n=1 Tax=Saccharothrix violaceirubra TaxID=413306 RepID=A0A7W7T222_9PSEU|nr:hypothetical protein [Saccharothrix violaceirubra]MBB4964826.1 hypothetical protein [Saccharothrix violaceirubra]
MTDTDYRDGSVLCRDDALVIRRYYFPTLTAKRVPYDRVVRVLRYPLTARTGRLRLWGTANPTRWFNLDGGRSGRTTAYVVDTGRTVKPVVTPDDPRAFERALAAHGVEITDRRR